MKHIIWLLGEPLFTNLFAIVYMGSIAWGVWLATGNLGAVLGAGFITVVYSVSLISRSIRVHLEMVEKMVNDAYKIGYAKANFDEESKHEND